MKSGIEARHFLREIVLQRDKVDTFEAYPFNLPALRMLERLVLHPAVTFLIGENGTGKSTLLEAVAVAWGFNPEGGSRSFNFATRASHSSLHEALQLVKSVRRPKDGYFLRAESFFNVATEIEKLDEGPGGPPIIDSYGYRSLHEQSHGEAFLALLTNRFRGQGLYILDEPEAALSPTRQMAMLSRLHELVEQDSQFLIATHSSSSWPIRTRRSWLSRKMAQSGRCRTRRPSTTASPEISCSIPRACSGIFSKLFCRGFPLALQPASQDSPRRGKNQRS